MKKFMLFAFFCVSCGPAYFGTSTTAYPAAPTAFMPFAAPAGLMPPPPAMGGGLVAYLHSWPFGKGPRMVELKNLSHYYLRVRLDGQDLVIRDGQNVLPHLPPGESAFTYTYKFEEVHVEADGYLPPVWGKRVAHLSENHFFSPAWDQQVVELPTHHFQTVVGD
jgi:hypothetical protein